MKTILGLCLMFGFDPLQMVRSICGIVPFLKDYFQYRKHADPLFPLGRIYPCLANGCLDCGMVAKHYFLQDLIVARSVFENRPERHFDIGSRIDGFIAHLASFRDVDVVDIRPSPLQIPHVRFHQLDFSKPLDEGYESCCDSLSCLHALEHFGLGRYGDPIDPGAFRQGAKNLLRMLKLGGTLYFSVPIGRQRVEFNAHRVFAVRTVINDLFADLKLKHLSYIDDRDVLHENVTLMVDDIDNSFGCEYGCGIFEFVKQ